MTILVNVFMMPCYSATPDPLISPPDQSPVPRPTDPVLDASQSPLICQEPEADLHCGGQGTPQHPLEEFDR